MKIKSNPKSPPNYRKQILRKKLIQTRTYLFDNEYDQFLQSSKQVSNHSKFGSVKIEKILSNPEVSLKSSAILNHPLKSQQSMDKKVILRYSQVKSLKKVNEINFRQSRLNIQEYSHTIRQQTATRKRRVTEINIPNEDQNNQKIFIIRKRIGVTNPNINMSRMIKQTPRIHKIINYQKCLSIYSSQCKIGKKMEIRDLLGIGANAQVREGECQGNKYAIKIYQKHKICSKKKKERIYTQIKILSSLPKHPNIINLLHAYENKNQIHIIFEHMDRAVTLADYFSQKNYKLPLKEVKKIFLKLTKGVNHLHNNNVTHRDLKPANIVLSFDEDDEMVLKIIDFGVATNQIKSDLLCGTRNFIAPELINKNKDINLCKCDIWALGVILFYLCEGHYPFEGNNEIQLYSNIKKGNFYYEGQQPSQIKDIIKNMLVVDPCRRLSAQQILKHNWFYQN